MELANGDVVGAGDRRRAKIAVAQPTDHVGLHVVEQPRLDYSWTGLGRFAAAAVDELELERFHLVVHDIGGPVGFELASRLPDRVASLSIFNTMVDVIEFRPPWSMQPFRYPGVGELWLRGLSRPAFRSLMRLQGIHDPTSTSIPELDPIWH